MLPDNWFENSDSSIPEYRKCPGFIGSNEAAVANDISHQNCGKPALGTSFSHIKVSTFR